MLIIESRSSKVGCRKCHTGRHKVAESFLLSDFNAGLNLLVNHHSKTRPEGSYAKLQSPQQIIIQLPEIQSPHLQKKARRTNLRHRLQQIAIRRWTSSKGCHIGWTSSSSSSRKGDATAKVDFVGRLPSSDGLRHHHRQRT